MEGDEHTIQCTDVVLGNFAPIHPINSIKRKKQYLLEDANITMYSYHTLEK